jgi:elongator complex protein 3
MSNFQIYRAIVDKIISGDLPIEKDLTNVKIWACRKFGLKNFPRNSEILSVANNEEKRKIREILILKPVRYISGVYIITVMTKPFPCPKEKLCIYCPGGPNNGTPQSYTGREPAGRRAIENNYDPYKQVESRMEQFRMMGHTVDKVELIIFGGTITAYPIGYLELFVTECLNAISKSNAKSIGEAKFIAEKSKIKISDITIETRPDYCKELDIDLMLRLGITRVELGVQTVYNDIYKDINRGHKVIDVIESTQLAKDSGLAVIYHMMPGLPGINFERDLKTFQLIFNNPKFKPDAIKIYPTLVMPNTKLHHMWRKGCYEPYSQEKIVELLTEIKKIVPKWVRIQRIQRDIPANLISAGVKRGDLRTLIKENLMKNGMSCKCIRCREVGHAQYKSGLYPNTNDVELTIKKYKASGGEEIFLSYEDTKNDILIGLLRLRYPSQKAHRPELKIKKSMLVRELHIYGPMVQVGSEASTNDWQHRGWGRRLLNEAERISREDFDAHKMIILAGIGTRTYYKRYDYKLEEPYMVKNI